MKKEKFKKYVDRYKDMVYNQAFYFTGSTDDASDITQEVLIKMWHHMDKILHESMKSWLLKVTRNLCIDYSRKKREVAASFMYNNQYENDTQYDDIDPDLNPEEQLINLDFKEHIFAAIQKLPPKIKSIIVMREIQDLKYEVIAEAMDLPLNSVKVYLHRGRKLLHSHLKTYYQQG